MQYLWKTAFSLHEYDNEVDINNQSKAFTSLLKENWYFHYET